MPTRFGVVLLLSLTLACSASERGDRSAKVAAAGDSAKKLRMIYESADSSEAALQATLAVLRARVEGLGDAVDLRVSKGGIVVDVGALEASELRVLRSLLLRPGVLAMKRIDNDSLFMRELCASVRADSKAGVLLIEPAIDTWQAADKPFQKDCYLSASDRTAMLNQEEARAEGCQVVHPAGRSACVISGRRILERYLAGRDDLKLADDREIAYEAAVGSGAEGVEGERFWRTYYQHRAAEIDNKALRSAQVQTAGGQPVVVLEFTPQGAEALAKMTESLTGLKLSIVLDGEVQSAPVVQSSIGGGTIMISLEQDSPVEMEEQARELARVLASGPLPAPLQLVSERVLSP